MDLFWRIPFLVFCPAVVIASIALAYWIDSAAGGWAIGIFTGLLMPEYASQKGVYDGFRAARRILRKRGLDT